ncbi:putative ribonuclease H-like domain-containing protein [Tanacetum coccineum]
MIRNKARLVAQGHRQEEGIDYEEVFASMARIEAIRFFLAYAYFMGFLVYQIDVKSSFLYGTIEEEVYVTQPPGFKDHDHPDKVYKVVNALYGLHQAPRAWYETLANYLLSNGFKRAEILKKFNYSDVKSASTPIDVEKPLVKDGDVDVHLYRSMIWSLMYLTTSRPDIMFAVCACARFQVTPKTSHLLAVKRIFRYLKGKPTLGLWYSRDSPFELVAYTDSDYAGATQDRKSTTGGCQFLGNRLISWQCKKKTVVATSTTEAKYVAAASCCGQVLWIQNQLLDYGYNFMNTVINIDNNSTICIIENPVQHSKTKHIEIRHHFIRDCNTKKLIQMVKIHTDYNVADLLTKGFDAGRFQYLVSSISKEVGTPRYLSLAVPLKKVGDEAVHKELGDRMERAATTASSLEAEQDSGSGPRGYTLGSGEDSMKQLELMELCTQLSYKNRKSVLFLLLVYFNAAKLMLMLLGSVNAARLMLMLPVQVPAAEVTLVDETQERQDDELMFDTGVLDTDEMPVEAKVDEKDEQSTKLDDSTAGEAVTTASVEDSAAPTTIEEITLAQTLIQIKAAKPKVVTTAATTTTTTRPKAKGVVVQEPSEFRVPQEAQPLISKDKGKGIMVEPEVPLKRKDQIALDEQIARDIQAKLDAELIEEQKLARKQEEEANIALIEKEENILLHSEHKKRETSKKQRMEEDKESDEVDEVSEDDEGELMKHLVIKKDEDIAIDAIPIATKLPVIID